MRSLLSAAVVSAFAVCAVSTDAAEISLRRNAEVSGAMVRLGDVAEVSDPTLADIVLGPKSARRTVTAQQVRDRLSVIGRYDASTTLTGASRCELTDAVVAETPAPVRTSTAITSAVKADLAANLKRRIEAAFPEAGHLQVQIDIAAPSAVRVAELEGPLKFRGGHADWTQPQAMEIVADPPIRFLARFTSQPVIAVAAVPLSRGQIVQASHVVWEPADDNSRGLGGHELVIGKQAVRPIPAGRTLQSADVTSVLLVRTGEIVTARVIGPGFQISRTMRARGSGGQGESITLVSLDGKQTLGGTISGYHECEVGGSQSVPTNVHFQSPTRGAN